MIKDFENMGREEFLQYITLVITYFYNMYDYLTNEEKEYINKFIEMLDGVYHI